MWLSARQTPDFRAINRFRSEWMKETIDEVFTSVLQLLIEEEYIPFEHYFLDGTKIEANANHYTYVWKKSTDRDQEKLQVKVRELPQEIDEVEKQEMQAYGNNDLEEMGENSTITAEKLQETVLRLEQQISLSTISRKSKEIDPDRDVSRVRQRLMRLSKAELVERALTLEQAAGVQEKQWLELNDELLYWRLRSEQVEARLAKTNV